MTDMRHLTNRLTARAEVAKNDSRFGDQNDFEEAAAEIKRLLEVERNLLGEASKIGVERDALLVALKPFADIHLAQDGNKRAEDMIEGPDLVITPKHVRAARRALGEVVADEQSRDPDEGLPTAADVRGILRPDKPYEHG